jgi:hypothetical protein
MGMRIKRLWRKVSSLVLLSEVVSLLSGQSCGSPSCDHRHLGSGQPDGNFDVNLLNPRASPKLYSGKVVPWNRETSDEAQNA